MVRNLSLSQRDFDALMRHALVLQEFDPAAAAEMLETLGHIQNIQGPVLSGELTVDKAKKLLGTTFANVVMFNFDSREWNRDTYLGYTILDDNMKTQAQKTQMRAKSVLEKEPWFKDFELVGSVTMTVDQRYHAGPGQIVKNPAFSNRGTANVGTLIVRDRATGNLLGSAVEYECLFNHIFTDEAAINTVSDLANCIVRNTKCRRGLQEIVERRSLESQRQ
ncbi:hypothetical protein HDR63_01885 [bacterium]|nr:hypothetical protein [bacterium]